MSLPPFRSLADFADAVFPLTAVHRPFAVLVAYFDESGTHDQSQITLLSGMIADTVIWGRMERPWKEHLAITGAGWYHAAACEEGIKQFDGIRRPFRDSLTFALSKLMCERQETQAVGSAVLRQVWEQKASAAVRDRFVDPYYFCFECCMHQISQWSDECAGGEPVALVFAEQLEYQDYAAAIHEYYRRAKLRGIRGIGSITFADPRELIELQAADLLGYELYRHYVDNVGKAAPTMRPAMQNFIDHNLSLIDWLQGEASIAALNEWMRKWADENGLPPEALRALRGALTRLSLGRNNGI